MKIFDWFNKKEDTNTNLSVQELIQDCLNYIPNKIATHKYVLNCNEHVTQHEWELAAESLCDLCKETGYFFSNAHWTSLSQAAEKLNNKEIKSYCRNQISRNIKEFGQGDLKGTVIEKMGEGYIHYLSEVVKDQWAEELRLKHKVHKLLDENGLHYKSDGRGGMFYYVSDKSLIEIEWELGAEGLIVWFHGVTEWAIPKGKLITQEQKDKTLIALKKWSEQKNTPLDIDDEECL
jgi:hypothetical protein